MFLESDENSHSRIIGCRNRVIAKGSLDVLTQDFMLLASRAKSNGDDTFMAFIVVDDLGIFPDFFTPNSHSAIALKLSNVPTHTDEPVTLPSWYDHTTMAYAAMFILTAGRCVFHTLEDSVEMLPGDWIIFDDGDKHHVKARRMWTGVSVQGIIKDPKHFCRAT